MRFVVFGAGAIGGVVGASLHQAGHEVALIARGAPYTTPVRRLDEAGAARHPVVRQAMDAN